MKKEEIRKLCLGLMQTVPAVILSTVSDDGMPYSRAMENLKNPKSYPDLAAFFKPHLKTFSTFFTTSTSSDKMRHIKANPMVSVYYCHPENYQGMMVGGRIEIVKDTKIKHALWQDGWEKYYPKGKDDPVYTILHLQPSIIRGWWQMTEFEFQP